MGSLFNSVYLKQLAAKGKKVVAEHNSEITLGTGLSFEEALSKAKHETKEKKLHLRGWLPHPTDVRYFFRSTLDGGEYKLEATLAAAWPSVDLCESPIEVAYYDSIVGRDIFGYKMRLQEEIACEAFTYRLDFLFLPLNPRRGQTVCVEIDGHAYHERTKEQAQYDKRRDRRLTLLGWRVLHFTGSEIFNNAEACALETIQHLESACG